MGDRAAVGIRREMLRRRGELVDRHAVEQHAAVDRTAVERLLVPDANHLGVQRGLDAQDVSLGLHDRRVVRIGELRGAPDDRVEDAGGIGGRGGDDPQDVGRGGLLLQCLADLPIA
ncbi:MAG: hypothetical protein M3N33_09250, partial [Actinomycetota bacterium]|nr:hypothetical protein [Actinomycetota bacterium]